MGLQQGFATGEMGSTFVLRSSNLERCRSHLGHFRPNAAIDLESASHPTRVISLCRSGGWLRRCHTRVDAISLSTTARGSGSVECTEIPDSELCILPRVSNSEVTRFILEVAVRQRPLVLGADDEAGDDGDAHLHSLQRIG
jgi:hypothetical protein